MAAIYINGKLCSGGTELVEEVQEGLTEAVTSDAVARYIKPVVQNVTSGVTNPVSSGAVYGALAEQKKYSYSEIEVGTYTDADGVIHKVYKRSFNKASISLPANATEIVLSEAETMMTVGILSISGTWVNQDGDTIYNLPYFNSSGMTLYPTLTKRGVSLSCKRASNSSSYTIYSVRITIEYYKY